MSKKELLDIVLLNPYGLCNPKSFKKKYPSVYKDILTWDFPKEFTFSQKLYHYLYDDRELNLGHCKMCDNRCKYRGFIEGYLECCSHKCAGNNEEKKIRTKQTCLKKYSTEHPMKNKSIKEKWRNTCISECGETHYMKSEKSKNKQTETNIKRYGVENVMYISYVVEKGRQTLFDLTVRYMRQIGQPYPGCGYGGRFLHWMYCLNPKPYNSFGNGSAIRVSAAAWAASTLEEALE